MSDAATKLGEGSGVGPMPSPGIYAQKAATAKADGESAKANLTGGSGSAAEQQAPRISSAATYRNDGIIDRSGGKASYWLRRAALNLDCAVQCCGTLDSHEIDAMERRCDELADKLKAVGKWVTIPSRGVR